MRAVLLCLTLALSSPIPSRADVKPAPIFGKGMVLQRGMAVPIWGTARADEKVTVSFAGQKKTATADKDGKWRVALDKLEAGGPHTLTIAGTNTVEFADVLVGEVWVCSGQSNMVWRLKQSENAARESESANLPRVRFNAGSGWVPCTPANALAFSACGYYFGRDLHKALDVPIGLINRSVGGTSARLWTSVEAMEAEPALAPFLPDIKKNANKGKPNPAGRLYAQMIKPIIPYAMRGVIWYQGESDAGRAEEYAVLFPTLIRSWRAAWGQGDFPFLYVQLAPIGGRSGWERLRETQSQTLSLPKTGMAVIIDGDVGIHPVKKQLPGTRLALAARAIAYGEKIVYSGPVYDSMKIDGDKVVVRFTHVGGGLVARGDRLLGFSIVDAEGKSVDAEAKIDGDSVIVRSKEVSKPVAVRYAWANNPRCNLTNKEGLPASPFRTDVPKK